MEENYKYKTCDKCCYDILDDEGDVMEHECIESNNNKLYPFEEGNDYRTIEEGEVVWSCWDDVSEEMHDKNPNKEYFITKESAINHLKK